MKRRILQSFTLAALVAFALPAVASERPAPRPDRRPPPEAFAACEGLEEGAACTVLTPNEEAEIEGTCRRGPDGKGELACAPIHPGPPPR